MFSALTKMFTRCQPERKIKSKWLNVLIAGLLIAGGGTVVLVDVPILMFTVICSPIFGIIGCLIPAWMVLKLPHLKKYRGVRVIFIIIIGIMLCLAPLAALLVDKEKHIAKTTTHEKPKIEQIKPR